MLNPVKSGILVSILILAPNALFLFLPPLTPSRNQAVPFMLMVAESIGRIGTLLIPVFYTFSFKRRFTTSALMVAAMALLIYYTA